MPELGSRSKGMLQVGGVLGPLSMSHRQFAVHLWLFPATSFIQANLMEAEFVVEKSLGRTIKGPDLDSTSL
jgi:hypothetical protein